MKADKFDSKLLQLIWKLPEELYPVNDLWHQIEAKLETKKSKEIKINFFSYSYRYVSAISAVFIMGIITYLLVFGRIQDNKLNNPHFQYNLALQQLEETAKEYGIVKEQFLQLLDNKQAVFSSETINSLKNDILINDFAVNNMKSSLNEEPYNPQLLAHLNTIYYEETNMLLEMSDMLNEMNFQE